MTLPDILATRCFVFYPLPENYEKSTFNLSSLKIREKFHAFDSLIN